MMHLVVNADDFGLTEGVNRAILECFMAGSVSNTTLMVNTGATKEAVDIARSHPNLGVGLHLNFTLGSPASEISQIKSLVNPHGRFYSRNVFERRVLSGRILRDDIKTELLAQIKRFDLFGLRMTHMDSHQHAHLLPPVFDVVAEWCSSRKLPLRIPWIWNETDRNISMKKRLRSMALDILIKKNMRKWNGKLFVNRSFVSVFDLVKRPDEIKKHHYLQILNNAGKFPLEIMVHPAYRSEEHEKLTRISGFSDKERDVLVRFSLREAAAANGIRMVSYKDAFASDKD
jgi:predicted glycoside hydrolase/deacetylase ChbG (UPF0249 family)